MTPEQFCYWLQGFAELSKDTPPTPEQWKSICEHIGTVFKKVTPPVSTAPYQQLSMEQLMRDREKSLATIGTAPQSGNYC
jgi:hypothetical protein